MTPQDRAEGPRVWTMTGEAVDGGVICAIDGPFLKPGETVTVTEAEPTVSNVETEQRSALTPGYVSELKGARDCIDDWVLTPHGRPYIEALDRIIDKLGGGG